MPIIAEMFYRFLDYFTSFANLFRIEIQTKKRASKVQSLETSRTCATTRNPEK